MDHLESIGAVEHRRHGHGRASQLLVTDAGHELLHVAREIVTALDTDLLGDIENPDRLRGALLALTVGLRDL